MRVLVNLGDPKLAPTVFAKLAMKDHVFDVFLNRLVTEYAIEVVAYVIMPLFEHISRVESVRE